MKVCQACDLKFELVVCADSYGGEYCNYCPRCGECDLTEEELTDDDDDDIFDWNA